MKTLIFGWANEGGHGKATLVCDIETPPADQARIIGNAKTRHQFPKGLKRLEMVTLNVIDTAVFIATNVGEQIEAQEKKQAEEQAKRDAANRLAAKRTADLADAERRVKETAAIRNEILGKLHQAESRQRNLDATPDNLRDELHDSALATVKAAILGDKKKPGLKDEAEKAKADYDEAVKALEKLKSETLKS